MRAIICPKYGSPDVLSLQEVSKPVPKENEILVKIYASSVNAGDSHLMRGEPFMVRMMFGLTKPKFSILGSDVAGEVEETGSDVKEFKAGDEIMGDVAVARFGAFAEYVTAPAGAFIPLPEGMSFNSAATLPLASVVALQGLRDKGNIKPGDKVLVNGASGNVGSFAVQIAKFFGAEVTGVCSTSKVDLVKSLGADHIIDYKKESYLTNTDSYDLIIDTAAHGSLLANKKALKKGGTYVMIGGPFKQMLKILTAGPFLSMGGKKLMSMLVKSNKKDLLFIKELVESGKIKPVIDKVFTLEKTSDAIRYSESGKAAGKIVIENIK